MSRKTASGIAGNGKCGSALSDRKEKHPSDTKDETTIRCGGFGPAEVAKVQRRAKSVRNRDWKLRAPRFRKINPRKRRKHHGIKTDA
jgi:hypothetical protein